MPFCIVVARWVDAIVLGACGFYRPFVPLLNVCPIKRDAPAAKERKEKENVLHNLSDDDVDEDGLLYKQFPREEYGM